MRFTTCAISVLSTYWSFLLLDIRGKSDFFAICFGCNNLRDVFSKTTRHGALFLSGCLLACIIVRKFGLVARFLWLKLNFQVSSFYFLNYTQNMIEILYEDVSIGIVCTFSFIKQN